MQICMDWTAINFDWNQARAFLATAEEGSLSAAARVLGQTQPTLGRQVSSLEQALGVVLFERVGKSLVLTPSGVELLDHVRLMREAAQRVSLTASGQSQTIEGLVRITASDVLSGYVLPPAIARLRQVAPKLEIDIVAANDIRDLQRREADIAIRHVRPEQPNLIARKVNTASAGFYASKTYLARAGRPQDLADLSVHAFIGFGDSEQMIAQLNAHGAALTRDNFRLGSASGMVAWEMARAGLGIVVMSDKVGGASAGMERLLPQMAPFTFPVWLTTHRELHTSRRIRLVFDVLADFLAESGV